MGIDLDAIEARANAATPGPWFFDDGLAQTGEFEYDRTRPPVIGGSEPVWEADVRDFSDLNSIFIAAARTDIPALVAEVRRLQRELEECVISEAAIGHMVIKRDATIESLTVELAKLKRALSDRDDAVNTLTAELQHAEDEAGSLREFNVFAQPALDKAYKQGVTDAAEVADKMGHYELHGRILMLADKVTP